MGAPLWRPYPLPCKAMRELCPGLSVGLRIFPSTRPGSSPGP
jgi:hypothetical protein